MKANKKKRHTSFIINAVVILIVFFVMFVGGCSSSTTKSKGIINIDFDFSYEGPIFGPFQELETLVCTLSQWNVIFDNYSLPTELNEKYNKLFFVENSLIVYAYTRSSWPVQTAVYRIEKRNKETKICLEHFQGDATAIWNGILIIEVAKEDIKGVTQLKIVSN